MRVMMSHAHLQSVTSGPDTDFLNCCTSHQLSSIEHGLSLGWVTMCGMPSTLKIFYIVINITWDILILYFGNNISLFKCH